ncbi:MAG: hypothetical protein WBN09_01355 [Woeseiaceae bacterium]
MTIESGGKDPIADIDDDLDEDDVDDTDVDIDDDDVDDETAEINVDELVAKIDSSDKADIQHRREVRRRLEEIREAREAAAELDSTFNFNLDDDL